jgi:hypothetical protein
MRAAYGTVDISEHALFGDPAIGFAPPPFPWNPQPFEAVMASGGRFLPQRNHNIFVPGTRELDLRWFIHGYLSTEGTFLAKEAVGYLYNWGTRASRENARVNRTSLDLGHWFHSHGYTLTDLAEIVSGEAPDNDSYREGSFFPPASEKVPYHWLP